MEFFRGWVVKNLKAQAKIADQVSLQQRRLVNHVRNFSETFQVAMTVFSNFPIALAQINALVAEVAITIPSASTDSIVIFPGALDRESRCACEGGDRQYPYAENLLAQA